MKKTMKFLKILGVLSIVLAICLPATAIYGLDPNTSTGVDNTKNRTLHIVPKDDYLIKTDENQAQFKESTEADGLADAGEQYSFQITRLKPTGSYTNVLPSVPASYIVDSESEPVKVRIKNTADKELHFTLPSPETLAVGTPESRTIANNVEVWKESASQWIDGNSVEGQSYLLNAFLDYAQWQADGLFVLDGSFKIEDVSGSVTVPWNAVVSLPTFLNPVTGTLTTDDINYDVYVYPKMTPQSLPQFDSYVDLISVKTTAAATTRNARLTDPDADWTTLSVDKGSIHTYTQSLQLNGLDYSKFTGRRLSMAMVAAEVDMSTLTSVRRASESINAGVWNAPSLVVNRIPSAQKNFSFTDTYGLMGYIIEDLTDPSNNQFVPAYEDTDCGASSIGAYTPSSGIYMNAELGRNNLAAENTDTTRDYVKNADGKGWNWNFSDLCNTYMPALGADIIAGKSTGLNGADFTNFKDRYSTWQEVFDPSSSIRIHFTASYNMKVSGTAFNAGESIIAKPFGYGATTSQKNTGGSAGTPQLAPVGENDFFSWGITPGAGDYSGRVFTKNQESEVYVTTGAVNAKKVTDQGDALAGAVFALKRSDGQYALKAGSTEDAGYQWGAIATPTVDNAYTITSSADGVVKFDGLAIDGTTTYQLEELAAPKGYKKLPTLSSAITPVRQTWAEQADVGGMTRVINVPILALPNTGGNGLLMLLAIATSAVVLGFVGKKISRSKSAL